MSKKPMMLTEEELSAIESGPINTRLHKILLARRLPKAELHIHLNGAIKSAFPYQYRENWEISRSYSGVDNFFSGLKKVSDLLTSSELVERAALGILEEAVNSGCRHLEMMLTPGEFKSSSVSPESLVVSINKAFKEMRRRTGLSGGIILEMFREDDVGEAIKLVRFANDMRDAGAPILGVGNDGNIVRSLREFAPAFELAKTLGFRTTCHLDIHQDVLDAIELPLDRVDHAYDLKGHAELQEEYRKKGVGITSALVGSHMALPGVFNDFSTHPLEELRSAGLQIALCTDDPAFFFTDLTQEYIFGSDLFGWSASQIYEMAMASLEMAWISEDREQRLDTWRQEGLRMLDDSRC